MVLTIPGDTMESYKVVSMDNGASKVISKATGATLGIVDKRRAGYAWYSNTSGTSGLCTKLSDALTCAS